MQYLHCINQVPTIIEISMPNMVPISVSIMIGSLDYGEINLVAAQTYRVWRLWLTGGMSYNEHRCCSQYIQVSYNLLSCSSSAPGCFIT